MQDSCWIAPLARAAGLRRLALGALLVAAIMGGNAESRGQIPLLAFGGKKDPNQATSSRSARQEVVKALPWDDMDEPSADKINAVLDDITIYRRLPTQTIECDATLYRYLVVNPDIVVGIWEALGISAVSLSRQPNGTFLANDGEGTRGRVEFLYASPEMHIVYANGNYDGPMFHRPVRGKSVLVLRSEYVRGEDGAPRIRCKLDVFVRLEHAGVEMLAKTFQPLVGKVADHNFKETTAFMASLSYTAAVNPQKVDRISTKLTGIPDNVRADFMSLCDELAVEASPSRNGDASTPGQTVTLQQDVRAYDGVQR
jgi:hypothetical protein